MKKLLLTMFVLSSLLLSAFNLPFVDSGDGIPQDWKLSDKSAQCQVSDGIVKLSGQSTGNVYLFHPGPALEKDIIYFLTCEARCQEGGDYMIYYEYQKDNKWKSLIHRGTGTGDWQKINLRFCKENDNKDERVLLRLMNNTSLEVRNLKIEEEKHDHGITDNFPESMPVTRFIHNGSFEWNDRYWTILSDAITKTSTDNYGNSCLRLGKFGFVVQPNIHLLPNHKYRLSWYSKYEETAGELLVAVRNAADKAILGGEPYAVSTAEYARQAFDFISPATPESVIDIIVQNKGGKPLRVTQFYLKEYSDEELSPLQLTLEQPCYRDAIFATMPCPFVQGTVAFKDQTSTAEVSLTGRNYNRKTTVTPAQPTFKFPTDGMADGDYQLTVKAATATISRVIHKYPHKDNEVVIDSKNNFYCNGQRYFPFMMGFLYEDPNHPTMTYLCANRGMTGIVGTGANFLRTLDTAHKHGLKVMLWIGGTFSLTDDYAQQLETFLTKQLTPEIINHPALFGYNYCDEPWALEVPAFKFAAAMELFRKLDPWHPLFINESPRGVVPEYLADYAQYSDIYGVDLYPLPAAIRHSAIADKTMAAVGKYSDIYNQATHGRKPVLMWLQGYQWVEKGEMAVIPNEHESQFMCLDAIMHDTKAIQLFNARMKNQTFYSDFFAITGLVNRIEKIIAEGTEITAPVKLAGLCARSFTFNGTTYHLLLNETAAALSVNTAAFSPARLAYDKDSTLNGADLSLCPWGFALFSSNGQMPADYVPLVPRDETHEAEKDTFIALAWERNFPKDLAPAEWIWFPGEVSKHPDISFDRTLKFDKPVKSAVISTTADNILKLYLDGKQLVDSDDWQIINDVDLTALLKPEGSLLHIEATNLDGPAAFMAVINVTFTDGTTETIASNPDWPVTSGKTTSPKSQSFGKFGIAQTWDFMRFIRRKK